MLRKRAPLDDDHDLIDLLERELEQGVHIDRSPEVEETSTESSLGGLVVTEEHALVKELKKE
jgi:hypothetical protein